MHTFKHIWKEVYTHKVLTMIKNLCTLHYLFFVFSNQTRFIMATYMNVAENNCKHKADLSFKLNVSSSSIKAHFFFWQTLHLRSINIRLKKYDYECMITSLSLFAYFPYFNLFTNDHMLWFQSSDELFLVPSLCKQL